MAASDYVFHKTANILTQYTLGDQLGQPGQFGVARLCTHKATYDFVTFMKPL
jgi:hypothetical protein